MFHCVCQSDSVPYGCLWLMLAVNPSQHHRSQLATCLPACVLLEPQRAPDWCCIKSYLNMCKAADTCTFVCQFLTGSSHKLTMPPVCTVHRSQTDKSAAVTALAAIFGHLDVAQMSFTKQTWLTQSGNSDPTRGKKVNHQAHLFVKVQKKTFSWSDLPYIIYKRDTSIYKQTIYPVINKGQNAGCRRHQWHGVLPRQLLLQHWSSMQNHT